MTLFNDCFGDLSELDQLILKKQLNAMTRIINKELENKPLGDRIIQLKDIDERRFY